MLRIFGESARDCDGLTRRSFLQVGTLGLGGLALPDLWRLQAEGSATGAGKGKSVILLLDDENKVTDVAIPPKPQR